MANENCLAGIRCPKCKSEGPFEAQTLVWAEWTDDGVDEYQNPDFADDGKVRCHNCDHCGRIEDFRYANQTVAKSLKVELLIDPEEFDQVLDLLSNLRDDNSQAIIEWRRVMSDDGNYVQEEFDGDDAPTLARDWELNEHQQKQLGLETAR